MANRGQAANLHIIITADKCTNPLFSDFSCKIYSGKTDRKTAQKYFGAVASALTNFDCSESGQALTNISGTIYKFNVPEIPENDIDSIMQELTGSADNAPVCPVNAPTVCPAHIRIKSHVKRTAPTETAVQPIQADAQHNKPSTANTAKLPTTFSGNAGKNLLVLFLVNVITLFYVITSRISAACNHSVLTRLPAAILILVLNFLLIPIKILYAVATSSGGTAAIICTVYMICATVYIIR